MESAVLFVAFGGMLLAFTAIAFLIVGRLVLSGSAGLEGDGLASGRRVPRWSGVDQHGRRRAVGSGGRWQLLMFADHSLSAFPSVVEGIDRMTRLLDAPEVLVLTVGDRAALAGRALPRLGLDVPVVAVPTALYHRCNVRVLPWVLFADRDGVVRASSLVNEAWQLERLWAIARAAADEHGRADLDGQIMGAA
jgi:hypothetical protein